MSALLEADNHSWGKILIGGCLTVTSTTGLYEETGIAKRDVKTGYNEYDRVGSRYYWWVPSNSGTGYTKISRGYRLISSTGIDRLCIGPCACGITSEYEEYIGSRKTISIINMIWEIGTVNQDV